MGNTGVMGDLRGKSSQSSVVRVLNVASRLEEEYGVKANVVFPQQDPPQKVIRAINQSDVAFFHRIQGSRRTWVDTGFLDAFATAKRLHKRVIYDVDDAIHLTFPVLASLIANSSFAVLAGSHSLIEHYRPFSRNVVFVPSAVDADVMVPSLHNEGNRIVLGWLGSARAHMDNLLALSRVLGALSAKHDLTFKILGTAGNKGLQRVLREHLAGVELDFGPPRWIPYREVAFQMADVDIGLYPLLDSRWNRAKCSLKLMEYMSMELPSCSSNTGENPYVIEEGRDGFLAQTDRDWIEKVGRLIEDRDLRREMGARARDKVVKNWSLQVVSRSIAQVIGASENSET